MHDPLRTTLEIREQLTSEKRRLAFFFGAGTSMAIGIPGINDLTIQVVDRLADDVKPTFERIKNELPTGSNIENILDRIRLYRELVSSSERKEASSFPTADELKKLDVGICQAIRIIVSEPAGEKTAPYLIFAQWLRALHYRRSYPVEIFTTNYDLLLEKSMEELGVPFFDGFVGSIMQFFVPESVEAEDGKAHEYVYPPKIWTRLWKLHGSINWYLKKDRQNGKERIARLSGEECKAEDELMIFPSRESSHLLHFKTAYANLFLRVKLLS